MECYKDFVDEVIVIAEKWLKKFHLNLMEKYLMIEFKNVIT